MSTPAVTRPGRPRARFALSRRWRRPVVAGLLIAVSLVLAPEQLAHGTGHLVAAGLMLAAAVVAGLPIARDAIAALPADKAPANVYFELFSPNDWLIN